MSGNYLAVKIVDAIIEGMCGRSGGDHWFESIDEETQQEIRDKWAEIIQTTKFP